MASSAASSVSYTHLQTRRDVDGVGTIDVQLDGVTDHHIGQRLLVGVLRGDVADVLALAQHRHAVGHGEHLMQLVGDDDERLAVRFHVAVSYTHLWIEKDRLLALPQWAGDRIFLDLMQKNVPFFSLKLRYEGETLAEAVLNGTPLAI